MNQTNIAVSVCAVGACLLAVPDALGGGAPELVILGHNTGRAGVCGPGSFSFISGNVYSSARASLTDPAAFGPTGVVPRTVVLSEDNRLEQDELIGADVVVVTNAAPSLTPCEQLSIRRFLEQGGGLIAIENRASNDLQTVVDAGPPVNCGGGTFGFVSPSSSHPILSGPFGELSGTLGNTFHCRFESLGPNATPLLSSDAPMAAAFEVGLGRAFVINEEEWAMDEGGCPAAPFYNSTGERMLRNALAWVAPDPAFVFIPGPPIVCPADLDDNCLLDLDDVGLFVSGFVTGDPISDLTGEGIYDLADVLAFVEAFTSGCP